MFKLPKLNLKKPHFTDEFKQEIGLVGFFCCFCVGIGAYDWRIACIIGGAMGMWFLFPRKG
jgi:hypothetical protein